MPSSSRRSTPRPGTRTARSSSGSSSASTAFAVIAVLASAGLTTLLAGIGVLFIAIAIEGSRLVARIERWRAFVGEPSRPPAHPYRPLRGGVARHPARGVRRREPLAGRALRRDQPAAGDHRVRRRRRSLWRWPCAPDDADLVRRRRRLDAAGLLGPSRATTLRSSSCDRRGRRACCRSPRRCRSWSWRSTGASSTGLLCTSESRELRRQVETLRESRSAVLDVEASELHRIERDLHDGAQQRLVMLTIDLGLASERIDSDPAAREAAHPRGPGAGAPGARRDPPAGARDRAVDPARSRARRRRSSRSPAAGPCRRSSAATSPRASGCRRPSSGRPTSSSPRRWPTSPSTAARRAARCAAGARGRGWSSRSGTTAPAARGRAGRRAGGPRRAGSRASTGRSPCRSPAGGPTLVRAEIPLADRPATAGAERLGAEVGQDREHAAVVVLRVGQLELAEDVADVLLGRAFGDAEEPARSRRSCDPRPSPRGPRVRAASGRTADRRRGCGP